MFKNTLFQGWTQVTVTKVACKMLFIRASSCQGTEKLISQVGTDMQLRGENYCQGGGASNHGANLALKDLY